MNRRAFLTSVGASIAAVAVAAVPTAKEMWDLSAIRPAGKPLCVPKLDPACAPLRTLHMRINEGDWISIYSIDDVPVAEMRVHELEDLIKNFHSAKQEDGSILELDLRLVEKTEFRAEI